MTDPIVNLVFELDGTIDPAQLEGLSPETRALITSPEFVARAAERIASHRRTLLARKLFEEKAAKIRAEANRQHEIRRPTGLSGRQRKRLRRAARKAAKALAL